jgi:hypothetical protein
VTKHASFFQTIKANLVGIVDLMKKGCDSYSTPHQMTHQTRWKSLTYEKGIVTFSVDFSSPKNPFNWNR